MKASKALSSVSFAALLLIAWWLLAPPQLGGRTSYAVIYGISMNPRFHSGDLVLLRAQSSYHVGEIVGYHSQKLGRPVMHRIIRIDQGGHYWFKGDNNNFIDPEHPTASELFGREWIRIPGFGAKLEKLHDPRNAAILAAVAAFFVLGTGGVSARRRRRRRSGPGLPAHAPANLVAATGPPVPTAAPAAASVAAATAVPSAPRRTPTTSDDAGGSFGLFASASIAVIGLAGLAAMSVLAVVAFTRGPATVVTQTNLYVEHGSFDYSAQVPVGAVYDHSPLHAGDALFSSVVRSFDVTFRYRMGADSPVRLDGWSSLTGRLNDGNGWSRRFPLTSREPFSGDSTTVAGRVDLAGLQRMIADFEKATGQHNDSYDLVVTPHVSAHGEVAGELVRTDFTPTLTFMWTHGRLRLATANDGAADNGLTRSRPGTGTVTTQRKLGALGVSTARQAVLYGLPISILLSLLGGLLFFSARSNDEVALIRRRYGSWMIDVEPAERSPHAERRVENMDTLARIAERYERLILHEQHGQLHSFLVEDDGIVYRYDAREKSVWGGGGRHHDHDRAETVGVGSPAGSGTTPDD